MSTRKNVRSKLQFNDLLTFDLLPWQRRELAAIKREKVYFLFVPRQNGKTQIIVQYALEKLFVENAKIAFTSHRTFSTTSSYRKIAHEAFTCPDMRELIAKRISAKGAEEIILKTGGEIKFFTRGRENAVGSSCDIVILDEAQFITADQMQALIPTTSTSQKMQQIFCGTSPSKTDDGSWIRSRREKMLGTSAWREYGLNEHVSYNDIGHTDIYAMPLIKKVNPSYGTLLVPSNLEQEINLLTRDAFLSERLGWWWSDAERALFSVAKWDAMKGASHEFMGVSVGVKFGNDGRYVSLAIAEKAKDGYLYVQGVDTRKQQYGAEWAAEYILALPKIKQIVVDGIGTDVLARKVASKYKKRFRSAGAKDYVTACISFMNRFNAGSIRHGGQPALDQAVRNVKRRDRGVDGRWWFGRISDDIDITIVEAAALALLGEEG